jgi:hypothetical protein
MFVWRDARGALVADVVQTAKMTPAGPRAFYVARVAGQQVEKSRFNCAKRVIEDWLRVNRIQATAYSS